MSVTAYFVSDVHLTNQTDERAQLFLSFLRRLGRDLECTHLFLLGDIFDLWLSDYAFFQNQYEEVVVQIRRLNMEGVAIHYFEGNHDLYLEKFWGRELGAEVHCGPVNTTLAGWKLRLEHGDELDPDDTGYLFLRWFLRTPLMKIVARSLPEAVLVRVGEKASRSSRAYTSGYKSQDESTAREKILAHGRRALAAQPFDILIAGHIHVREDRMIGSGETKHRVVNLGSWMDNPSVFVLTPSEGRWLDLGKVSN
ncbi:MAG: UDP-2,3-diacylglucosamine diphosphatase [Bdellovibrionales bacterium]|nr:UDP-2,3-diacylglucosamine diphosphatase [Bdellovibrionales bacterium]